MDHLEWRCLGSIHQREQTQGGGELLVFVMTGPRAPSINAVMFESDEEDTDDESTHEYDPFEDDPFESSIVVAQRVELDDDEKDHIRQLLPPKDEYIGVPYVTRLTSTNLARYVMVRMILMLFWFFSVSCAYNVCRYMT